MTSIVAETALMVEKTLVIFDCDGVLLDTEFANCVADAEAFTLLGRPIGSEEIVTRFAGATVQHMVETLSRESEREVTIDAFTAVRDRLPRAPARALPGARDCLEALRDASVPYCVASSSELGHLRRNLEAAGLADLLGDQVFSAGQVAYGKPWPDLFVFAAAEIGYPAARCLVVEDSVNGVVAARAAGMSVVGLTAGSHCLPGHADRLLDAGATAVLKDWHGVKQRLLSGREEV